MGGLVGKRQVYGRRVAAGGAGTACRAPTQHNYDTDSMIMAMPWPPPMQALATP